MESIKYIAFDDIRLFGHLKLAYHFAFPVRRLVVFVFSVRCVPYVKIDACISAQIDPPVQYQVKACGWKSDVPIYLRADIIYPFFQYPAPRVCIQKMI
jgi:hypothetical protein